MGNGFWKEVVNKRTCLCTKSMEEKGDRQEVGTFLHFTVKLWNKFLRNQFNYKQNICIINPLMVLSFKTFQNLLTGKMAINMSEPFKTLHNFLLLHYHTFQYPLKGFER